MTDRQGIEIDYCPQCRGVWLDRGELDKIIERSAAPAPAAPQPQAVPQAPYPPQGYAQQSYGHKGHYPHKRRKSWLEEIFD
jgi:Zn-finger nucleic acid-binding protein